MNIGEKLVGSALQSLGYFTIQGLKAGVREADFLAVKMNGEKVTLWHIEVQISRRPIGNLRAYARLGNTGDNPIKAAREYIDKKFFQRDLCRKIEFVLGTKDYRRMFIHGRLRSPEQLEAFKEKRIECLSIGKLVEEAAGSETQTESFKDFYGVASQVKFSDPHA